MCRGRVEEGRMGLVPAGKKSELTSKLCETLARSVSSVAITVTVQCC